MDKEALHDPRKVSGHVASSMNYDKFQAQRQPRKMNALLKNETRGLLKEREVVDAERAEMASVRAEWRRR